MNAAPLACDMNVFTPSERERHVQSTRDLLGDTQGIREMETGFEFFFPNSRESLPRVAEFIAHERLCCPFLEFTVRVGPGEEPISIALTGPEGTKDFLREEFDEVFA